MFCVLQIDRLPSRDWAQSQLQDLSIEGMAMGDLQYLTSDLEVRMPHTFSVLFVLFFFIKIALLNSCHLVHIISFAVHKT